MRGCAGLASGANCACGGDHSSRSRIAPGLKQPTRGSRRRALSSAACTGRAGPPLLFGFAPRGVFRALGIAAQAVGSYPTFSPLPNALRPNRPAPGLTGNRPPRSKLTGGLFSVALSVAGFPAALSHRKERPPDVIRRVALGPQAVKPKSLESGLSSRPPCLRKTDRRSPGSPACAIVT